VLPPAAGDDWIALSDEVLPVAAAYNWAVRPDCGAVVLFAGTVRDHADGRDGVEHLEYEAYDDAARRRFGEIVAEARRRWPTLGRVAALHRVGRLGVSEVAVVVVASAPHRDEAFEAGRYTIDTLKESAPIWKHETWRSGADWGTGAMPIRDVRTVGGSAS
jgi:molybdopterin synthase catalytic subunit